MACVPLYLALAIVCSVRNAPGLFCQGCSRSVPPLGYTPLPLIFWNQRLAGAIIYLPHLCNPLHNYWGNADVDRHEENIIYPPEHNPKWWRQHPDLWAKALKNTPPDKTHKNAEPDIPSMLGSLHSLFGPGFIVAGLGVMSRDLFIPGVVLVYLGCGILWLETIFEPFFLRMKLETQCLCIAIVLCLPAWFTLKIVAISAPLQEDAYYAPGESISNGQEVEGIARDQHLTYLRVAVTNPESADYRELNLEIHPDYPVYDAKIVNRPSFCDLISLGGNALAYARESKGGKDVKMFINPSGNSVDFQDSHGDPYTTMATDGGYSLRCSTFPRTYTLRVILALLSVDQQWMPDTSIHSSDPNKWNISANSLSGVRSVFDLLAPAPEPKDLLVKESHERIFKPFVDQKSVKIRINK